MLKEISIEIIRKCPNECLHCSSLSDFNCTEKTTLNTYKQVIIGAKKLGLQTVNLSGGEPFLHEDIEEFIDFANNEGISINVYTSGIIKKDGFESLDESLIKNISKKVSKLIFNFEAANENVYDKIMGTSECLNLLKRSIMTANRYKIYTEAHFVPMKLNLTEIVPVIELCLELGISRISFLRLVLHGRAEENAKLLMLNQKEHEALREELLELKDKYLNFVRIGVPLSTGMEHKCEAAKGKLNIRYDGEVFPCEVFKNKKFDDCVSDSLRNINDTDITELYLNSKFLNNIRDRVSEFETFNSCEKCYGQHLIEQLKMQ